MCSWADDERETAKRKLERQAEENIRKRYAKLSTKE